MKSFSPNISGFFFQLEEITFSDSVVIAAKSLMKNPDEDSKVQDVAEWQVCLSKCVVSYCIAYSIEYRVLVSAEGNVEKTS